MWLPIIFAISVFGFLAGACIWLLSLPFKHRLENEITDALAQYLNDNPMERPENDGNMVIMELEVPNHRHPNIVYGCHEYGWNLMKIAGILMLSSGVALIICVMLGPSADAVSSIWG